MSTAYADDFYTWTIEQADALRRAGAERVNTSAPIHWGTWPRRSRAWDASKRPSSAPVTQCCCCIS